MLLKRKERMRQLCWFILHIFDVKLKALDCIGRAHKKLHQHQNPEGRMNWQCSRYDIPHRAQIAGLSDAVFQAFGGQDNGAEALAHNFKDAHCWVWPYEGLMLSLQ